MAFWSKPHTYTVHEPPDPASDRGDRAEALVFIRDGFSLMAYIITPVWLLMNRLWLPFLGYAAIVSLIVIGFALTGGDPRWMSYAIMALHFAIGFEADSLRRWGLERRGWRHLGAVNATTTEEGERRFFEHWLDTVPAIATGRLTPPGTPGGLSPEATSAMTPPPYQGDLIPPRRSGWRAAFSTTRNG